MAPSPELRILGWTTNGREILHEIFVRGDALKSGRLLETAWAVAKRRNCSRKIAELLTLCLNWSPNLNRVAHFHLAR